MSLTASGTRSTTGTDTAPQPQACVRSGSAASQSGPTRASLPPTTRPGRNSAPGYSRARSPPLVVRDCSWAAKRRTTSCAALGTAAGSSHRRHQPTSLSAPLFTPLACCARATQPHPRRCSPSPPPPLHSTDLHSVGPGGHPPLHPSTIPARTSQPRYPRPAALPPIRTLTLAHPHMNSGSNPKRPPSLPPAPPL